VCGLPGGQRAYARTTDPEVLAAPTGEDLVGRSVELRAGPDGTNTFCALRGAGRPRPERSSPDRLP
jgi:hypothetical protein